MALFFWHYCAEVSEAFEETFGFSIGYVARPGLESLFRGAWKDDWSAYQTAAYVAHGWGIQADKP